MGVTLEVLARAAGAERIMELGSGFGYSAYWHARAVGSRGEVHLTDGDPENEVARGGVPRVGPGWRTGCGSTSATRCEELGKLDG